MQSTIGGEQGSEIAIQRGKRNGGWKWIVKSELGDVEKVECFSFLVFKLFSNEYE